MSTLNYSQPLISSKAVSCHRAIIEDEYVAVDYLIAVLTITLNLLTCPLIVLLNTLVIIAVRTKPSLRQTKHNILLSCMAGTDLAVGILQPAYIAKEILIIRIMDGAKLSSSVYCTFFQLILVTTTCLCLISLFHLALIAFERYMAMKYSLRYDSIVTELRLTVAAAFSWLTGTVFWALRIPNIAPIWLFSIFVLVSLLVIIFCHVSVYLVSRRHMKQIKCEQVSPEAKRKFIEENKALKTTTIIFCGVLMSYLPIFIGGIVIGRFPSAFAKRLSVSLRPLTASCLLFNSLFNPIIYCWRNKYIRHAVKQLLKAS